MGFKKLNLKFYYNNDEDDLVNDFYIPVISNTKIYKRAAGFFSSSSFWEIVNGLKIFVKHEGRIQLIVSPNLSEKDIEAINLGEKARQDTIDAFIIANILNENKFNDQFNLLAWLIYKEKLEIKFIIKKDINKFGIFHDKSAIMIDNYGEKVAYHGSLNESVNAYSNNYEAINLFMSWVEHDNFRIEKLEESFNSMWNNNSNKWEAYSISESIKKKIINKMGNNIYNVKNNKLELPENLQLREYQKDAINSWIKNRCSGILEMATGSGKTFTSIFALSRLISKMEEKGFVCGVVIVVPYKNLLEQWCDELIKFKVKPIKCYKNKFQWYYELKNSVNDFNNGTIENLFVIATNTTFVSNDFQEMLMKIKRNYIFCVDEMHHLSAPKISGLLPQNAQFRLGLTATLYNEFEEEKFKKIVEYFNGVVYRFTLEDAMKNNCLTKYYYYPVFIELTDEERERYVKLTKEISKMSFSFDEENESLKAVINQRRRIVLNASNKINEFIKMEGELRKYNKTLVYCGDSIDEDGKFIDKINRIIYQMGLRTHTYSSDLNDKVRQDVMQKFEDGRFNVLTAIKCLDEGIDVPALECAFILSSNMDSKQFIQRRGRILRKSPNKEFAYIYDFVVVPTLNREMFLLQEREGQKIDRRIFGNELKRVYEFASLCENKSEVLSKITDVLSLYSLGE